MISPSSRAAPQTDFQQFQDFTRDVDPRDRPDDLDGDGRGDRHRRRIDRRRDFAAWVGLVPWQYSTGGRTVLGRISKRGSRCLRMLFVQAAKVIMMRRHRWSDFSFGAWLTRATRAAERMHRNELGVARADKLARMAWSVLRHGTRFDEKGDAAMAV